MNAFVIGLMTLAVLVVLIPLLIDLLRTTERSSRPPFEARYADLVLHIPDRPDLYQAAKLDFGLVVSICDRRVTGKGPAGCEVLSEPLVNRFGIWTSVKEPRTGTRFKLLKERPQGDALPGAASMIPVPETQIDKDIRGTGEAYQLSRLAPTKSEQLVTTERGWPIAACGTHPLGSRYCRIGFLIKGAFVEAHVYAEAGVDLNQAEIWAIASALESKIRDVSINRFDR